MPGAKYTWCGSLAWAVAMRELSDGSFASIAIS
jgi:hypothetical protein